MTTPEVIEGAAGALLVIISGPSGVGKDTIIDALRDRPRDPRLPLRRHLHDARSPDPVRSPAIPTSSSQRTSSRRSTTRASCSSRRRSTATTTARRAARSRTRWSGGHDVILKIDVQGAAAVKERVPDALLVFIVPPTLEALFQRLRSRATETADELEIRQRNAAIELARQGDYDQVVVNETGEIARTAAEIEAIIEQEKRRNPDRRMRIT